MKADTAPPPSKGKVLLVEDEPISARAYSFLLQRGGFTVVHISDGQDALEALYHTDFAVVVLDLILPHCDGIEILKKMREMPRHRITPTVVLTSADLAMTRQAARQHGVLQFLIKGQSTPTQILEAIEHIATIQPTTEGEKLRMLPTERATSRALKGIIVDPLDRAPTKPEPKTGVLKKLFGPGR